MDPWIDTWACVMCFISHCHNLEKLETYENVFDFDKTRMRRLCIPQMSPPITPRTHNFIIGVKLKTDKEKEKIFLCRTYIRCQMNSRPTKKRRERGTHSYTFFFLIVFNQHNFSYKLSKSKPVSYIIISHQLT